METLKRLGLGNEHAIDRLSMEEISQIKGFGAIAQDMVRMARGLASAPTIDLLNPEAVEAAIFGEDESGIPLKSEDTADGLEELVLVLRMPPRRIDWLNRLSALSTRYNPYTPHPLKPHAIDPNSIEALVIRFINQARLADDTDAGRRTGLSTTRRED